LLLFMLWATFRKALCCVGDSPLSLVMPALGFSSGLPAVLILAPFRCGSELEQTRTRAHAITHVTRAFVDPVRDFFHQHGRGAALALVLVCTYRLPDLVRSIGGPFYRDVGFTLAEIARVQRVWES